MMLRGTVSEFGGPGDMGVSPDEGLACYEVHEAEERLDLFYPVGYNQCPGLARRLRPDAHYFAMRFPLELKKDRKKMQATQWVFRNPANWIFVVCWLVDWGPHESTKRTFDLSHGALVALRASTDLIIEGVDCAELKTVFQA